MTTLRNFNDAEFACNCGCGRNKFNSVVAEALDDVRDEAGIPLVLTSAYRCPTKNITVGGSPTSSHLKGLAVDIAATRSHQRFLILKALFKFGFTRIGIGENFIHADMDGSKDQNVVWVY